MDKLIEKIMTLSEAEHSDMNERFIKLSEEVGEIADMLIRIKNCAGSTEELKIMDTPNTSFEVNIDERVAMVYNATEATNNMKRELCTAISKEITDVLIRTIILYKAVPGNTLETLKKDVVCKMGKLQYNISNHRL